MDERRYVHSWENAPVAIYALDRNGVLLEVNKEWERSTGYSAAEVVGRSYLEFVPAEHLEDCRANLAHLVAQGELVARDCYVERKDGRVRNMLVFGRVAEGGGRWECMLVDITDSRETERELVESNRRFRSLFAFAPTPIVIHDGRGIVMLNQACAEFLGYGSPDELIGKPLVDVVAPEDRPKVAERVRRMMTEEWVAPVAEERFLRRDGTFAYGEAVAAPVVLDGRRVIHVTAVDLTGRREAERALAESEVRFRDLFEFSADPILVHDGRKAMLANRAAVEAFGLPSAYDVTGTQFSDFIGPESLRVVLRQMNKLLEGRTNEPPIEVALRRRDGTTWFAEARSAPIVMCGERVLQTSFRDLTERRRVQEELACARAQLEEHLAQRTESLQRVTHELGSVTDVASRTVEMRDPYAAGHQQRVAVLAVAIARHLGMDETEISQLETAARIHDVGKVSLPAELLAKPTGLTGAEYEHVKTHVDAGYELALSAEFEGDVAQIIRQHHERLDGSGYPQGLSGDELRPMAKVLMVADVVEAMRSHRPHRPGLGTEAALGELLANRGTLYDRDVVDTCVALLRKGFDFEGTSA